MSDTALTGIQEIMERTLFEAIRQEVVDKGYLPDIADTVTYPDDQTGWDQWEADIQTIIGTKGFAIEVFGVGNNTAKGVKKVPRIFLETGNFLPGSLGGDPTRFFSDQGADYKALVTPPQTVDFYMNAGLVAETVAQSRILNGILALAIPRRAYMPWYNDATHTFFIQYLNYYDRSDVDQGILEHVYAYEIPDAWDREDVDLGYTVAKLSEITVNTNVQKYEDGSWGADSTPLVVT